MNKEQVEKKIGRKLKENIKECTSEELEVIGFWTQIENRVLAAEHQRLKDESKDFDFKLTPELDQRIEKMGNEILKQYNGNVREASAAMG